LGQIAAELGVAASAAGDGVRRLRAELKQAKEGKAGGAKPAASSTASAPSSPSASVPEAVAQLRSIEALLAEVSAELKSPPATAVERIRQLRSEIEQARSAKSKASSVDPNAAYAQIRSSLQAKHDGQVGVAIVKGFPAEAMRGIVERLKKEVPDFALALLAPDDEQVAFVVAAHGAPAKRVKAGDVAKAIGPKLGGGGGGRPDFAQGQGRNPAGAEEAAAVARELLGA
ncbi:MAG TPA: DHHA1 domain-containing protein, partial [Planctomycetota bacterium]|nr:DHHA1 domain-containing protein [Planctomycetota bacterium]